MTFAHTMDSSWRRRHASSCSSSKRVVPFLRADSLSWATPLSHDHHDNYLTQGGCTPIASTPPHLAPPLSEAAGDSVSPYSSAVDQQRKPWKGSFPLHRVGELSLERVGNSASGTATAVGAYSGVFAPAMREVGDVGSTTFSSSPSHGMGEEGGGKAFDWRDGLGQVARVLALSISSSQKRKLLCDRKDPFAHLSPRRLTLTVLRSGLVVAAPMMNEVILDSVEDMDDDQPPGGRSNRGGPTSSSSDTPWYLLGDGSNRGGGRVYVDSQGRIVRSEEGGAEGGGGDGDKDLMKALARSFKLFPYLTTRRVLHSVMTVSTQRLLEWQAVVHLSTLTADRLTKNISLSALRKTKRMPLGVAAAKMSLTAGKALFFQNLALFIVDEVFLAVRLALEERKRRKNNPYACTDWTAILREMRSKTAGNATFALCIWAAGTVGTMVGTLVHPKRGPELMSLVAEMGASSLLT